MKDCGSRPGQARVYETPSQRKKDGLGGTHHSGSCGNKKIEESHSKPA
jgi:hypothetical protein